jgi:hypothetical protein
VLSPDTIPRIDGDMTALAAHADALTRTGAAIVDTGARVHQGWQELAAVYQAPEGDQLFAATGPVMSVSTSVGEDIEDAATALRLYAADTAYIQARLDLLRLQAGDLVDAYDAARDESTTVTLDDRSAALSAAVAAQIAAWEDAQLRCANTIRALTGAPRLTSYTSAMTLVEYRSGIEITSPLMDRNSGAGDVDPPPEGGRRAIPADELSGAQADNLRRYKKRLPAGAGDVTITGDKDGSVDFEARVPGRVPGSYAIYTKTIGPDGTTIGYEKTTFLPDGSIAHVKDKMIR